MGALFSVCGLGSLACCATSAACSCISCITPAIGARIMYSFMLLLVTISGWIMTESNVSSWLGSHVPFCWSVDSVKASMAEQFFQNTSFKKNTTKTSICENFTGYLAVYRLMFAACMFFLVFGLIMIKVRSPRDPRVSLHRGWWPIKFLILIGGIVGAFYIPAQSVFGEVWKNFGFGGSFFYLLIQVSFVIIFADEWANDWVSKMEEDDSKGYYFGLLAVTVIDYILSFIGIVLFYVYYGGSGCGLHNFFISINFIIILILSTISILPKVQEYNQRSGLLQSSILSLYLTYMTWSALNSSPQTDCKPRIWSSNANSSMDFQSFISLIICFACVIYSSIRLSSREGIDRIAGVSNVPDDASGEADDEDHSSWPYFYFVLALGTLYLMMTLTNWFTPTESYKHFGESTSSLWVKMISSWFSATIYLWVLIAPVLLHDYRDF